MSKYYKIIRKKDNKLVGLTNHPMPLKGYEIVTINKDEFNKLRIEIWTEVIS